MDAITALAHHYARLRTQEATKHHAHHMVEKWEQLHPGFKDAAAAEYRRLLSEASSSPVRTR